jgi:hypothetical protein
VEKVFACAAAWDGAAGDGAAVSLLPQPVRPRSRVLAAHRLHTNGKPLFGETWGSMRAFRRDAVTGIVDEIVAIFTSLMGKASAAWTAAPGLIRAKHAAQGLSRDYPSR